MVGMIWAQAHGGVIGADGGMPWHVPEDLAHFRRVTLGHPVIMGRRTWESFPERFRPLPGRENVVLTRTPGYVARGALVLGGLAEALASLGARGERAWIIGGGGLYAEALPLADTLVVTDLDLDVAGDTRSPAIDYATWRLESADPDRGWHRSRTGIPYRFTTYRRMAV